MAKGFSAEEELEISDQLAQEDEQADIEASNRKGASEIGRAHV
jgi:hypothetical protein